MSLLLAVDPSINAPGVALFRDGVLHAAVALKPTVGLVDRAARCSAVAYEILDWYLGQVGGGICAGTTHASLTLAVEWPQVYTAGKSKGDPNDLIGLAGVCSAVAAVCRAPRVLSYLPGDWCKLPKVYKHGDAFVSIRGERIMSRLSSAERALVPRSHDAVDAVGIGLHALGRLAPRRVYPGAVEG